MENLETDSVLAKALVDFAVKAVKDSAIEASAVESFVASTIKSSAAYVITLYKAHKLFDVYNDADEWVVELFNLSINESPENRDFLIKKYVAYSEVLKIKKKLNLNNCLDGVLVERYVDEPIVAVHSIGLPDLTLFSISVDFREQILLRHNELLYLRFSGLLLLNNCDILESIIKIYEKPDANKGRSCTYIGVDDSGLYKIGRSANLKSRISHHRTSNPSFHCLYYTCSNIENLLHSRFANARVNGEFFSLGDNELQLLVKEYSFVEYVEENLILPKTEIAKPDFDVKGSDLSLVRFLKRFGNYQYTQQGLKFDKSGIL